MAIQRKFTGGTSRKSQWTDKICQMYEEEQINKIRNGRKLVPDNKMPNLSWNLKKQETMYKEEIQEIEEINKLNKTQEVSIHMIIFIYSYILLVQDIVFQYTKTAARAIKQAARMTKNISCTSWTKIQKEVQARIKYSRTCQENRKNQSYGSYDYHNGYTTTQ